MESVRWGVLGAARIAREQVIPAVRRSGCGEVVAVSSASGRAGSYAADLGIPRAFDTHEELLADPEVDAVYIALPNALHAPWIVRAARAGKHVLCEKPLVLGTGELAEVEAAVEESGVHLAEAFMYRHHPQMAKLAELVRSGAIGELRVIRSVFSYSLYDADNIRLRTEVEGGALMDVGCYCVSGSRLLGGEPVEAHGNSWIGPTGTDWVTAGVLRFPNNVLATFDCGTALTNRDELEAIGSEGSLFLDDPWHCNNPVIELRRGDSVERIEVEREDSYRLELENVSDAIRGEAELLLGRDDAIGQARTLEALHRSATAGGPVAL